MTNKRNKTHRRNKTNSRKHRRVSKKMYGGRVDQVSNAEEYQQNLINSANVDTYNKTLDLSKQKQDLLDLQAKNADNYFSSPGIGSMEKTVGTAVSNGIGNLAENVKSKIPGLQSNLTNGFTNISKKVEDIKNVLNSEQGKELLNNAGQVFSQVYETVVKPVAKEAIAEGNKLIKDEGKILLNEVNEVATVLPPVLAVEEVANMGAALGKAVESGAHMVSIIADRADAIGDVSDKFVETKEKYGQLMANASDQVSNKLQIPIDVSMPVVDEPTQPTQITQSVIPQVARTNGGSLKKIRRQSKMIGGRCKKAQDEFLHPQLVLSQLINQHKRTTKRSRKHKR